MSKQRLSPEEKRESLKKSQRKYYEKNAEKKRRYQRKYYNDHRQAVATGKVDKYQRELDRLRAIGAASRPAVVKPVMSEGEKAARKALYGE